MAGGRNMGISRSRRADKRAGGTLPDGAFPIATMAFGEGASGAKPAARDTPGYAPGMTEGDGAYGGGGRGRGKGFRG